MTNNLMHLEVELDKARARLAKYKPGGASHTTCLGTIASLEARHEALQEAEMEAYSNLLVAQDG